MTFLIESLIACALFTLLVFLMSRNPIKIIFNYSPAIIRHCDELGLDCIWFCHDKHFVIPGWFHIKGALIGMLLGIPAAVVAGIFAG